MSILALLATVLGSLVVLRSVLLLFYAEAGRKQDLIKHIYRSGTDFNIVAVIPYLDSRKLGAFQDLLQALANQDYPSNRLGLHVVVTEETAESLPPRDELPANLTCWTYPAKNVRKGVATAWLVERLLAAGGPTKLFAFLDADDIVRPDFLKNVTTRAYDCFAMQGYIALKRPPRNLLDQVVALSTRLINRIENAGRFHMGMSCRLMNSGWVVRQELLEMLPYRQGQDIDNLEYTLMLNLQGYRVNWAPNVVVYKEEKVDALQLIKDIGHSIVNRARIMARHGVATVIYGVTHFEPTMYETAFSVVKLPNFILGLLFGMATYQALYEPAASGGFFIWAGLALVFWSSQLIALGVARCNLKDVVGAIMLTPVVFAASALLLPFTLVLAIFESTAHLVSKPKKLRIGKRFDESQDASPSAEQAKSRQQKHRGRLTGEDKDTEELTMASNEYMEAANTSRKKFGLPNLRRSKPKVERTSYETHTLDETEFIAPAANQQQKQPSGIPAVTTLPITNGKDAINCILRTFAEQDDAGEEVFSLVFEYKHLAFRTQKYRILDQAYYELETKLQAKGFSIVSCGSCANFYRPTAGNDHGVAKNIGFCLKGKEGQEVNIQDDGVTVLSQACEGYVDMVQRPTVVRRWQESLDRASVLN